ncbi:hypothetical protein MINTM008_01680 [Mycobacterium intracellulare]|uniref:Uncharacterized protein n=1 Tax=Mycobacterium paraintracellulare TaxID=1138383 RepID=A0ABN6APH3_9MYCO|nr:hypothetical protein MPRI_19470 [Mycobacterium paraintracellulare]BCO54838.1 hypothetical protein MINTM005_00820 [Mycobacterium intracellulare]BCO39309.1 hypothetical protein MINTM001_04480 [Mycobacterium paraintracellulare]BCO60216.1 hypothetical protein MINTM006_01660 [Mycobacterium intracellulare]BCO70833.1 hypothetical protein MINTM008_01680 [Mycobacterium intracellulare]
MRVIAYAPSATTTTSSSGIQNRLNTRNTACVPPAFVAFSQTPDSPVDARRWLPTEAKLGFRVSDGGYANTVASTTPTDPGGVDGVASCVRNGAVIAWPSRRSRSIGIASSGA